MTWTGGLTLVGIGNLNSDCNLSGEAGQPELSQLQWAMREHSKSVLPWWPALPILPLLLRSSPSSTPSDPPPDSTLRASGIAHRTFLRCAAPFRRNGCASSEGVLHSSPASASPLGVKWSPQRGQEARDGFRTAIEIGQVEFLVGRVQIVVGQTEAHHHAGNSQVLVE